MFGLVSCGSLQTVETCPWKLRAMQPDCVVISG
jgi:hypothetical protein